MCISCIYHYPYGSFRNTTCLSLAHLACVDIAQEALLQQRRSACLWRLLQM